MYCLNEGVDGISIRDDLFGDARGGVSFSSHMIGCGVQCRFPQIRVHYSTCFLCFHIYLETPIYSGLLHSIPFVKRNNRSSLLY